MDAEQLNLRLHGSRPTVARHQFHGVERFSIAPRIQISSRAALEEVEGKARDTAAGAALNIVKRRQALPQASLGARSAAGAPAVRARRGDAKIACHENCPRCAGLSHRVRRVISANNYQ